MKWTIAILTVPERAHLFGRLMNRLWPQVDGLDIEIMVADQEGGIGKKRQWCLDNALGEYFNFIDDDDLVPVNYVDSIYPLLDGVDYIGFQLQLYWDGTPWNPTYHSLRYNGWSEDERGHYRDVSHLNPIRTEIAREGRFEGDWAEDCNWARQVHPKTEHYIDQIMYYYYFSPSASLAVKAQQSGGHL